jgi:hypothetical protein
MANQDNDKHIKSKVDISAQSTIKQEGSTQQSSCLVTKTPAMSGRPIDSNGTISKHRVENEPLSFYVDNPVEFWKKWSCMTKECFDENGSQGKMCTCFEGIGSVM